MDRRGFLLTSVAGALESTTPVRAWPGWSSSAFAEALVSPADCFGVTLVWSDRMGSGGGERDGL